MVTRTHGFFPFSSLEIEGLKKELSRNPDEIKATMYDVGRLLATIEWYQDREASLAMRLGNSQTELDVLFSPENIEAISVLEGEDTTTDLNWSDIEVEEAA